MSKLPTMSSYMKVAFLKSQSWIAKQVRLGRQEEASSQQALNAWFHKGCFTTVSHTLWIHCSPVLTCQWLSPLTISSADFTSSNWSQPLPLASGFWYCISQIGKFAGVAIKQTISHHKPHSPDEHSPLRDHLMLEAPTLSKTSRTSSKFHWSVLS